MEINCWVNISIEWISLFVPHKVKAAAFRWSDLSAILQREVLQGKVDGVQVWRIRCTRSFICHKVSISGVVRRDRPKSRRADTSSTLHDAIKSLQSCR